MLLSVPGHIAWALVVTVHGKHSLAAMSCSARQFLTIKRE